MARPKNMAMQEQILAEAQKRLDRINKMQAEMAKQVEVEMARLNEMRERHEDFTQSVNIQPSLGTASPASFQSQFDQFNTTKSNERLKPGGNTSAIDFAGKIEAPKDDIPFYRTNDRAEHYTEVDTSQTGGKALYVSGYYRGEAGGKEYEYRALPGYGKLHVGQTVQAVVQPQRHNRASKFHGKQHMLDYTITDIYEDRKFMDYIEDIPNL